MSRRVIYKCDSCGHSWEGSANPTGQNEVWTIAVSASNSTTAPHVITLGGEDRVAAEWCRDCVVRAGITKPLEQQKKRKVEPLIEGRTQSQRVEGLLKKLAEEFERE